MKWPANATNGTIVAGGNGGGSLYTQLDAPRGVFVDSFQTVYVGDQGNYRVVKWLKGATNGTLVVGTGISGTTPTQFNQPSVITFDTNGNLYVVDNLNNRVQRFAIINNTSC
jgi:hypothetical protein